MVSFSSSAVNKSGKKFAPKIPVRRPGGAASSTPTPANTTVHSKPVSQTAQQAADKDNAVPPPSVTETVKETSTTTSEGIGELDIRQPENVPQRKSSVSAETATFIPIPAPKPRPSVSTAEPVTNEPRHSTGPKASSESLDTPVSIPTPISRPISSLSASEPATVEPLPSALQSSRQTPSISTTESVASRSQDGSKATTSIRKRQAVESPDKPQGSLADDRSLGTTGVSPPQDDSAQVRPAKRIRVSETEVPAGNTENFPTRIRDSADVQGEASESQAVTEAQNETTTPAVAKKGRKATKPRKKRTAEDGDGEVATDATGGIRKRWRKKREPTPEGAELVEIVPTAVKMSELCKDVRTGKMSKREMELRNMELAELQRRKKEKEESRRAETPIKQNGDHHGSSVLDEEEALQKKPQAGPRMRIVNGEIVIDTASLQVDRHADASREAGELEDVVENTLTRKINQSTYGKRTKTESWDEEMTDLFYRGLRMFGTDFMMISKMFPGRSRRQIKLKFNGEERRHPERIRETLLGPRETIDIETYSEMTNTVYDDPRAIQKELDEEKKRMEDQHAKEKEAQEELLRNPGDGKNVLPSIEQGAGHNQKSRSRNIKTAALKVSGGTEEILGSIDDLPVPV